MKIAGIRLTPLEIPYRNPYHMQQGARTKAALVLIEIETDTGLTGVGECMAIPNARFIQDIYEALRPLIIGANPFEIERIWQQAYRQLMALPASDMDRMARLALAGLDFALHDLMGKALNLPVYSVLGGAVHDDIRYFAFIDGETPEKVAAMGREYVEQGIEVFYLKLGRGEGLDIACTAALRGAIGARRLRVDPNEAWDVHQAIRMIRMLSPYDLEFVEQPVSSHSMAALQQVRQAVNVSIAADQSIHSPEDVFAYCQARACDVIVLGAHETGGLRQLRKAAAVAETAGIRICLHGVPESGITTLAHHHAALTIPNIDDGNQIMTRFLAYDLISAPDLSLGNGCLGLPEGPGLGLTIDPDNLASAAGTGEAALRSA